MATIYYTASSADGFIATGDHSLEWLFTRDIDHDGPFGWSSFQPRIGATVMGANTHQWLLDHAPGESAGPGHAWVMTHRPFPPRDDVTFTDAPVSEVHARLVAAAGDKDVWVAGGGGVAAQFAQAGLLDEVWLQYAPVSLGAGAPLLAGPVELRLEEVDRNRDFVCVRYAVVR